MLDPWIIEEILKREGERHKENDNRVELPLEPSRYDENPQSNNDKSDRGVIVIDI